MMYPSKAVFTRHLELETGLIADVIDDCFLEVFSPKYTAEELIAGLEAKIQETVGKDPAGYLHLDSPYGLQPKRVVMKISHPDNLHLSTIIDQKGKNLHFGCRIEYEEIHLVGIFRNKYLITNLNTNPWDDYAEVIYIPEESGLVLKKLKYIE